MALATRGRYYLRRQTDGIASPILDADGNPSGERLRCHVTGYTFERPDMLASAERGTARGGAVRLVAGAHARRFRSLRASAGTGVAAEPSPGGRPKRPDGRREGAVMAEAVDTPTAILANAAAAAARDIRSTTSPIVPSPTRSACRSGRSTASSRRDRTCSRALAGWIESTEFPLPPFVTIAEFREAVARAVPRLRRVAGVRVRRAHGRQRSRRRGEPSPPSSRVRSWRCSTRDQPSLNDGIGAGSQPPCATSRRRSSGRACARASR